jgi:sec-independent protein translocase protein TatA
MPFQLGTPELLIILVIVIVLFGVGRIGRLGADVGRAIHEFRKEVKDVDDDKNEVKS